MKASLRGGKELAEKFAKEEVLSVIDNGAALVRKGFTHEHHLFTKFRKQLFKEKYDINVHDFVIDVDELTHELLHAGQKPLKNKAGWWDAELMKRISKLKKD